MNEKRQIDLDPAYAPLISSDGPLTCPTRYLILTGGRGSGKSFAVSLGLSLAMREPGMGGLYTRWTMASARDSIIPEFREKITLLGADSEFDITASDINHQSGSRVMFRGIKTSQGTQTAKLKSLQGLNLWVLDEAEEMPDESVFDTIDLSIRDRRRRNLVVLCLNPAHKRHWIYRRWFDGRVPDGFCGVKNDVTYIHTDYQHNLNNLPESYQERIRQAKIGDPTRFAHVWRGKWAEEVQGALWDWSMFRHIERADVPDLVRVVVAVDPNATSGPRADEAGIIVAGESADHNFYLLADASARIGPAQWARVTCQQYEIHRADRIVAEQNNGGEMVRLTINGYKRGVPVHLVNASRGKITRAEPIASLYSQGRVHHVGRFPELESEMMSYTGEPGQSSPNRMDAAVWALSDLSGSNQGSAGIDELLKGCVA